MNKLWLGICFVFMLNGCSNKEVEVDQSRIYFAARAVPGANIYSTDLQLNEVRHTYNSGARDIDMTLDAQGNLFFTSNRVLPEDRAERAKLGKRGNRRQDLNVFYLPAGTVEEKVNGAARPIDKTAMPESLASISQDGSQFAFVRTQLPSEIPSGGVAKVQSQTQDQLFWKEGKDAVAQKIYQADVILKPEWSPDNQKLIFSSYDFKAKIAKLAVFDRQTKVVSELLRNPWGVNQIDAPQWSPDGTKITLIRHPVEKKQFRTLFLMDVKSKGLSQLSKNSMGVGPRVSWSSDSRRILFSAFDNDPENESSKRQKHIYISSLNGELQSPSAGQEGFFAAPVFSPDNQKIAYLYTQEQRDRKAKLKVMDLQGKEIALLHENVFRRTRLFWQ